MILMGDFYQLEPVGAPPIWIEPFTNTMTTVNPEWREGHLIWRQFESVVILTEQMPQSDDMMFQEMLKRAKAGMITEGDLNIAACMQRRRERTVIYESIPSPSPQQTPPIPMFSIPHLKPNRPSGVG